jgi:hypothetical protein
MRYAEKPLFVRNLDEGLNDSIVFTINIMMGYPYFRCREQVVRLMMMRYSKSKEICEKRKGNQGVRASIFSRPFALTQLENGRWLNYSLQMWVSTAKSDR